MAEAALQQLSISDASDAADARLAAIEARIAALEARLSARGASTTTPDGGAASRLPPSTTTPTSPTQARLDAELAARGVTTRSFLRVPADYYDHPLAWRAAQLGAPSVRHLCKTLTLENTRAREPVGPFAPDARAALPPAQAAALSRFFLVIVQYTAKFDAEALRKGLVAAAAGAAPGKAFNLRLASEEDSAAVTGYEHNAVTPVGVARADAAPLILASAIAELNPPLFWMGGGEVDLKLGVDTAQFCAAYGPTVLDITVPADGEGE